VEKFADFKTNGSLKFNHKIQSWIGTSAEFLCVFSPVDIDDISSFVKYVSKIGLSDKIITLGAKSNILIREEKKDMIAIILKKEFAYIDKIDDTSVSVGSAMTDLSFANMMADYEIGGCEFMIGIPGTIGGNIAMNAGCYGKEIKDVLVSCRYINKSGDIVEIKNEDMGFYYRHNSLNDVVVYIDAIIKGEKSTKNEIIKKMHNISSNRQNSQPIGKKTLGSTFRNVESASIESIEKCIKNGVGVFIDGKKIHDIEEVGDVKNSVVRISIWELIDKCGLRGYLIDGAMISDKHPNFLINNGGAKSQDFLDLIDFIKVKVFDKFGIDPILEIKII
jgi:UDP-N-acetylmuramate dehydrogenase